jgi:hypothetical protein
MYKQQYRRLEIGEIVQATDEIRHRNHWLPATEYSHIIGEPVYDGMAAAGAAIGIIISIMILT